MSRAAEFLLMGRWVGILAMWVPLCLFSEESPAPDFDEARARGRFERYCFDCHDPEVKKGNLDLVSLLSDEEADLTLPFEHVLHSRMPPPKKDQPSLEERQEMLRWLSKRQPTLSVPTFRRLSRHELIQSINDLLGLELDLAAALPEDRGTYDFDTDRRIQLTPELLGAYFDVMDEALDAAFPLKGVVPERLWVTNRIKDSHRTYNIYTRPYREGILFSWTRANNGNNYSFFYDGFDPPLKGWYDLTFDASKVGLFPEAVSLMVYAGKYYYADDRPQPQRLLGVISLEESDVASHTLRAFLHPGESVSVHCYSKHNFREQDGDRGAYIENLRVRGPVYEEWPPVSYRLAFADLPLQAPAREPRVVEIPPTRLEAMGGRVLVSSEQEGMAKDKMLDGSNRTFWHTRFSPTLAEPPHYVILENPKGHEIEGLSYSTWSGGNGNGQVEAYAIYLSDDRESWGEPIAKGTLEIRLASEQTIPFPRATRKRYIKFLVTEAFSLDGRSLASIGRLDVLTPAPAIEFLKPITVSSNSSEELKDVVRRFAERAFSSSLTEEELQPYYAVAVQALGQGQNFVSAARLGMKAVLGSHRFLMVPGEHANAALETVASLARILWLSVPDPSLMDVALSGRLSQGALVEQIERMLEDPKSDRMIRSFCDQWLRLRDFEDSAPSLKLYPLYDDLLNHYLPLETHAFLGHLIRENAPVSRLIDADFSFLNQRLAQHYDVEGVVGQQLRRVPLEPDSPRGGLLTMGSILKVTAGGFDTSPILRGAWLSKNIVGNTLSPPPESVEAIEPMPGEEAVSLKEQVERHKNSPACFACHKSIDPYGFALESFDATGQWRTNYRIKQPHSGTFQYRPQGYFRLGGEVDPSGAVDGRGFADVLGLKSILLSEHKKVAYNFMRRFFEYANGFAPTLAQRLDLYARIPEASESCGMKDLVVRTLVYSLFEERE